MVRSDVVDGYVSRQEALKTYGVVLRGKSLKVDRTGTDRRRDAMRREANKA